MTDAPKLKDFFSPELVAAFGDRLAATEPSFDRARFVAETLAGDWESLSLTERSQRMADSMWTVLAVDAVAALTVATSMLPSELEETDGVLNDGFWMWPLGDLIATYAVDEFDAGLTACRELTKRFTAEFAVRPFLARYPEALDVVAAWAGDDNEHVRRLASEGTRPRLPWATRLDLPLDPVIEILTALRADPSLYVRRSVANHLNDLAKDHSDRIVDLLEEWHAEGVEETTWIVRHAMRNHLKNGDRRVLALFGYAEPLVEVTGLAIDPPALTIGESATVTFDLSDVAGTNQRLMIDLVIGFAKANGKQSPKVFKFKDIGLPSNGAERFSKRFEFVHRSTRRLHPGDHSVAVRVNGADLATASFELSEEEG